MFEPTPANDPPVADFHWEVYMTELLFICIYLVDIGLNWCVVVIAVVVALCDCSGAVLPSKLACAGVAVLLWRSTDVCGCAAVAID